jgi:hypothetical protein
MTAQPVRTYQDPSGPTGRAWRHPGMFIECVPSSQQPEALERARQHAAETPSFAHRTLHTAHDAMVTAPQELTDLLIEAKSPTFGGAVPA